MVAKREMFIPRRIMTVDPGMNTGWAAWPGTLAPTTGVFRFRRKKKPIAIEDQLCEMWIEFEALIKAFTGAKAIDKVIIEGVQLRSLSADSWAARSSGDLVKLSYLIGGYALIVKQYDLECTIWDPTWKGSLTEEHCHQRVQKLLERKYRNHEVIAVAMGLKLAGLL